MKQPPDVSAAPPISAEAEPVRRPPARPPLLHSPRGRPAPLLQARRWLRILGPGLVTGAADDDPSGIGTYSQAGAAFGTAQLWLALYMLPLLIAVQEVCARIGLVTGQGIAAVVRKHYSRRVLFVAVSLALVANILTDHCARLFRCHQRYRCRPTARVDLAGSEQSRNHAFAHKRLAGEQLRNTHDAGNGAAVIALGVAFFWR